MNDRHNRVPALCLSKRFDFEIANELIMPSRVFVGHCRYPNREWVPESRFFGPKYQVTWIRCPTNAWASDSLFYPVEYDHSHSELASGLRFVVDSFRFPIPKETQNHVVPPNVVAFEVVSGRRNCVAASHNAMLQMLNRPWKRAWWSADWRDKSSMPRTIKIKRMSIL